jgi:hypothetical protein
VPDDAVPDDAVPDDAVPDDAVPDDAVPDDAVEVDELDDDSDDPAWAPELLPPPWVEASSPSHGIALPYEPPHCEPPHCEMSPDEQAGTGRLAVLRAALARRGVLGLPNWVVSATAGGAACLVLGVGSAIAVPAYRARRAEARLAATEVRLPAQVLGLPRRPELEGAEGVRVLAGLPPGTRLAVYSDVAGPTVTVVALPHRPLRSDSAQRATWLNFERSLQDSSTGALHLDDRDPGPLGGRLACGRSAELVLCLATDPVATLGIVAVGVVRGGTDAVAAIRPQVEHQPE